MRGVIAAQNARLNGDPLIARQSSEQIGLRQQITPAFSTTMAFHEMDAQSETVYDPDAGVDTAGPGSRRDGYEVNPTYHVRWWLEIYGSCSGNHARYVAPYDDGAAHVVDYHANAPFATGSLNVYIKNMGPWSGSVCYPYLSCYSLSSDELVQGNCHEISSGHARYVLGKG